MGEAMKVVPQVPVLIPDTIVRVKVNPRDGLRVADAGEDARMELFIKGSEPDDSPPPTPRVTDFYRMDTAFN